MELQPQTRSTDRPLSSALFNVARQINTQESGFQEGKSQPEPHAPPRSQTSSESGSADAPAAVNVIAAALGTAGSGGKSWTSDPATKPDTGTAEPSEAPPTTKASNLLSSRNLKLPPVFTRFRQTKSAPLAPQKHQTHEPMSPGNRAAAAIRDFKARTFFEMGWEERWNSLIIHPESLFRFRWTIALAISLLYIAITVPLQMGFAIDPYGVWQYWEYCVDAFFIVDVVVNFFTGYTTDDGAIEMRPKQVAINYVTSIWFPIDVITSIPFDWIEDSMSADYSHLKMAKIFRALKAMKVLRLNRLLRGSIVERIEDAVMQSATMRFASKMAKLLVGMLFAFHWCACIMHMTAQAKGKSWVTEYLSLYGTDGDDSRKLLYSVPLIKRYLYSVYWTCTTMSTVGYGDIVPTTDTERLVTFLMMIVGGSLYGFLIGNMNSIVLDVDANTRQYNRRMESILSYMNSRKFPNDLQRKVIRYYRRYFKSRSALDEKTVLAELSSKLKTEVAHFLIDGLVFRNPIFEGLGATQLATLTTVLKPVFFDADEFLVRTNDTISDIFIIAAGTAQVQHDALDDYELLGHGDSFGEEALAEMDGVTPLWQINVVATTTCEAMLVPIVDLRSAFAQTQNVRAMAAVREKCKKITTLAAKIKERQAKKDSERQNMSPEQRKVSIRSKFKKAVNRQVIIGKLGGGMRIVSRPGETAEQMLARTVELKAKEMDRERHGTTNSEDFSQLKASMSQLLENVQRMHEEQSRMKRQQTELFHRLDKATAAIETLAQMQLARQNEGNVN